MAGFVIEGLEDALKKMDEMTKNVAKKHVKKALRAAAKPVLQSAKDNAKKIDDPKTSADISKNLVVRTGKTRQKSVLVLKEVVSFGAVIKMCNVKASHDSQIRITPLWKMTPNIFG